MLFRPNPSSGVPIYLQLMEQVKHAIETGALRPGRAAARHPAAGGGARDQPEHRRQGLPRARARRRHRAAPRRRRVRLRRTRGAKKLTDKLRAGQAIVAAAVERLRARGVTDEEIRRLFEAELAGLTQDRRSRVADAFVIETADLRKHYDGVEALRGLSLAGARRARSAGSSARNGAGKTTTIKVLLGHGAADQRRAPASSAWPPTRRTRASRSGAAPGSSATTRTSTTT